MVISGGAAIHSLRSGLRLEAPGDTTASKLRDRFTCGTRGSHLRHHEPTYSQIIDGASYERVIYDHRYIREADGIIKGWLAAWLLRLRSTTPIEVLELGTGTGRLARQLSELPGLRITAIDHDPLFIAYARDALQGRDVTIVEADATSYQHPTPLSVVVSGGLHHHIAKGHDTDAYLRNVYRQLRPGGCYVMDDEFLPDYADEEERQLRSVVWYSHIIASALRGGYRKLAEEEAKTLVDDLAEGEGKRRSKHEDVIHNILSSVIEIDDRASVGDLAGAISKARDLCAVLLKSDDLTQVTADEPSRGDYKICDRVFRQEVEQIGFRIVHVIREGPAAPIGGMYVYVLQKPNHRRKLVSLPLIHAENP